MCCACLCVQVLIADCGMCKEPESLLACIASQPQQLVLIGDHKQLQPNVLNKTARSFGLDRSLFDRYATQAYMLTTQYRMVRPSVCLSVRLSVVLCVLSLV